jgi:putative tryptophan/tyrosine transport system substrate-binding protein
MTLEGADAVFVGDEPEAGGFMAHAFEILDLFRYNADIMAKILAGAKPGDIPIYQARKFGLSFNLKTAKALGIEIPGFLLPRADELID